MTRTREWEATLGLVLAHACVYDANLSRIVLDGEEESVGTITYVNTDGVEIYTSTPLCFNQYKRIAKKVHRIGAIKIIRAYNISR